MTYLILAKLNRVSAATEALKTPCSQGPMTHLILAKSKRVSATVNILKPPCSQGPMTHLILANVEEGLCHH